MNDKDRTRYDDPDRIRRDIEATRDRIERKFGALKQEASRPLMYAREAVQGGGRRLLETFRDNPVPMCLMGVGLGWIVLRDVTGTAHRDRSVQESDLKGPGKIKSGIYRARAAMQSMKGAAYHRAHKASDWFGSTLESNPILLAAISLGAGLVAGLAIPASEMEEKTAGTVGEKIAGAVMAKGTEALKKDTP